MKDIWRTQNPTRREFTWRKTAPMQQSRIDYIFVTEVFRSNFEIHSDIHAGVKSDHSIITMTAESVHRRRGPGLYRFNNELLSDTEFVEQARKEIFMARSAKGIYEGEIDIGVKLEMLMSSIRVTAIRRSKNLARQMREEENRLLRHITECERDLKKLNEDQKVDYEISKQKLDEISSERAKRAILASGARWVEEGEKVTAYFLSRGKQLSAQKTITQIRENGKIITDNDGILECCARYYEQNFRSIGTDRTVMEQLLSCKGVPKLSNEEKEKCEGPISDEECRLALSKMNKNKAPGVSGLTPEFFIHFWEELSGIVIEYINNAFQHGFFINQRRGVVTLIPKKGQQSDLRNRRPICLLDVLYKLVAKVIANRLGLVVEKLICPDQTGFVKGRYIGENLRLLSDVIEYCQIENHESVIVACDYRSAFDSLEHEFLFEALKAYNFGENLIGWIKVLYSDASLAIINNGLCSRWFSCQRGTFQGSPLSGILFILAIEILAINIRSSVNISGINISGIEAKISMYADDITLLLKDSKSGAEALRIIDKFSKASGLHLNLDKCHAMWLGKGKEKRDAIGEIKAVDKMKVLGIWFSASKSSLQDNMEPVMKKIDNTINIWSQRSITIKGRITITRALIASQIVYISSCIEIPKKLLRRIQSKIMQFVWRGRPPKVAKDVLVQDIEQGGLKLIDVEVFVQSLRSAWIRRLYMNQFSTWRRIVQARIGKMDIRDLIRGSLCKKEIKTFKIPEYYKNILIEHQCYNHKLLDNVRPIQQEMIWYNRSIRSGGKTLFIYGLYRHGIKYIDDLAGNNGALMCLQDLKRKIPGIKVDFLTYNLLLRAIPQKWKEMLANSPYMHMTDKERSEPPNIWVNDQEVSVAMIRSKHYYKHRIINKTPKAIVRWEELGYIDMNWEKVFMIPYKCTKSTQIQSLQYRILNRYIPTKRYLYIRQLIGSPQCAECGVDETLEHFFYRCSSINSIWAKIFTELGKTTDNNVRSVLFGISGERHSVNLIILLVKQYIVKCKLPQDQVKPTYAGARNLVIHHVTIEKYAAIANKEFESFTKKWQGVIQFIGSDTIGVPYES